MDDNAMKLDAGDDESGKYQIETICDSAVYAKNLANHLQGLYYLVSKKSYSEEENTWEFLSTTQHLRKLISSNHPNKSTATFEAIDSAPPMARPIIKPTARITK